MPIHQGKKLKAAVDASKLKVKEISEKSGIAVSSMYDIFRKEDVPRRKLQKLCEALGIDFDEFYWPIALVDDDGKGYTNLATENERLRGETDYQKQRISDMEKIIMLLNKQVDMLTNELKK